MMLSALRVFLLKRIDESTLVRCPASFILGGFRSLISKKRPFTDLNEAHAADLPRKKCSELGKALGLLTFFNVLLLGTSPA